MITINSTPKADAVLMDANDTLISVTSSNGAGYYFRAVISIDDQEFDVQSWSRIDLYTATVNLRQLYQKYYEFPFSETFTSGVSELSTKKKVSITVKEYAISDDSLVDFKVLPTFYILYNQYPKEFDSNNALQLLHPTATYKMIPDNGKIVVVFYANQNNDPIYINLLNSAYQIVDSQVIPADISKKVHVYQFDLSALIISDSILHFRVDVLMGSAQFYTQFKRIQLSAYPVKELAYLTDIGIWSYGYFTGLMNIDANADIISYQDANDTTKNSEINMTLAISLGTGALRTAERSIADEVIQALDARLFYNGKWREVAGTTKKIQVYRDRLFNYGEAFTFALKSLPPVVNQNVGAPSDAEARVLLGYIAVTGRNFEMDYIRFPGYTPTELNVVLISETNTIITLLVSATSPITSSLPVEYPLGTYVVYLQEVDTGALSNSRTITFS